jgi:hypothetical protein
MPYAHPSGSLGADITVISISRYAAAILGRGTHRCREVGRFRQAVNLLLDPPGAAPGIPVAVPRLVALVTTAVGNGPFHIVVSALPPATPPSTTLRLGSGALHLGPWRLVTVPGAPLWSPAACWAETAVSGAQFARLRARFGARQPTATSQPTAESSTARRLLSGLGELLRALDQGEDSAVAAAAAALAGLGPGLTPAGDDILAGVMLALYAAHHDDASRLAGVIYAAVAPHTTLLSRAFLAAASRGEMTQSWHDLLGALTGDHVAELDAATERVLAFGASSGFSMLRGFVSTYPRIRRKPC